LSNETSVSDCR